MFSRIGALRPSHTTTHSPALTLILSIATSQNIWSRPIPQRELRRLISVLRCLSERLHNVFARDHPHHFPLRINHWKAASLQAHHQLKESSQWCGRLDRGHTFGHDLLHCTFHQVVVVGHHLTGGEDKGSQKIE